MLNRAAIPGGADSRPAPGGIRILLVFANPHQAPELASGRPGERASRDRVLAGSEQR